MQHKGIHLAEFHRFCRKIGAQHIDLGLGALLQLVNRARRDAVLLLAGDQFGL